MSVGAHAAVACPNCGDGLADTLPWPMFRIPHGSIGVFSRVKGRLSRFPQFTGGVFHRGVCVGASRTRGVKCLFVGRELIDGAGCGLGGRGLCRDLQFRLPHGCPSSMAGNCGCGHRPQVSPAPNVLLSGRRRFSLSLAVSFSSAQHTSRLLVPPIRVIQKEELAAAIRGSNAC